jgi:RND family efflux transporter MFP subunit
MNRWLKIGIPVLVILLLVVWINRQLGMTAIVAPAKIGTAVNAVTGTVEVLANADIRVKARHRGVIVENRAKPGEIVEADAVLSVQASEDLDLEIEQVQIRLEAARAREELESTNKIDLESVDEEIEGVELAVELKQAPVSRLENLKRGRRKTEVFWKGEEILKRENRRLLENQLAQLTLKKDQMLTPAPFAGTIAEINAFKGDLVNPGQNLVRLISHGRIVILKLTEEDYYGVKEGQPVTLRLASYPDQAFDGTVQRLEDVADSNSKTRNVFVKVDAVDSVLVPGLTGEGYLVKDERANAVLIPRRALIGNLVYVVDGGVVDVRRVRPGYMGLNQAEILEGIEEGDQIILENQNLYKPGDHVEVVESGAR